MSIDEKEAAFMASLLGDIESSFFNAVPSPFPSPARPKPVSSTKPARKTPSPVSTTRKRLRSLSPTKIPLSPVAGLTANGGGASALAGPSTPSRRHLKTRKTESVENIPAGPCSLIVPAVQTSDPATITTNTQVVEEDLDALLDGADDWAWDDMLTPQKAQSPSKTPKKGIPVSPRKAVSPAKLPSLTSMMVQTQGQSRVHDQTKVLTGAASSLKAKAKVEVKVDYDRELDLDAKSKGKAKLVPAEDDSQSEDDWEPEQCTRCIIKSIEDGNDNGRLQKNIIARTDSPSEQAPSLVSIILRDDWAHTTLHPGDTVNVIGPFTYPTSAPTDDSDDEYFSQFEDPFAESTSTSASGPSYAAALGLGLSSSTTPASTLVSTSGGGGGTKLSLPTIIINTRENLIIAHPDTLLTATAISSAPHCLRRPLLSLLTRSSASSATANGATKNNNAYTPALLYGNLLHAILERALSDGRWDDAELDAKANEVVRERMDELLRVDVDVPQARRELKIRARGLRGFADRYLAESALVPISSSNQDSAISGAKTFSALDVDVDSHGEQHGTPKPDAILLSTRAGKDEQNLLSITRTLDVEEDIWSPSLGLRGKLDAAVMATVQPAPPAQSFASFSHFRERVKEAKKQRRTGPVPFEIKTGRPNGGGGMEHRAQTMLYTMLLEERMGRRVERGLLYYTQSEEVVDVPVALQAGAGRGASAIEKMKAGGGCGSKSMGKGAKAVKMGTARNEVRALVGVRNELAAWVGKRGRMWDREWRESRKRNGEEVVGEVDESKEAWRGPPHEDKKSKVDGMSLKSDVKLGNVKQEKAVKVEQGEDMLIEEVKTEGVKMEEEVQATKNMHSVAANVQDDVTTGAATLAFDLHELEEFLPPPIDDERVCTRCYALDTCMLFRKASTTHAPPAPDTAPALSELFERKTSDLTLAHAAFFRTWERLLAMEEHENNRHRRELWTLTASERERRGRCFAGMKLDVGFVYVPPPLVVSGEIDSDKDKKVDKKPAGSGTGQGFATVFSQAELDSQGADVDMLIDESQTQDQEHPGKGPVAAHPVTASSVGRGIHRSTHRFVRSKHFPVAASTGINTVNNPFSSGFASVFAPQADAVAGSENVTTPATVSLLSGHISLGDPIVVSTEPLMWPGLGYTGDRRGNGMLALARGFVLSLTAEEVILAIDHVLDETVIRERMLRRVKASKQELHVNATGDNPIELLWRIDKEELISGAGRVRDNLAQMFYPGAVSRLRELVVDLSPPEFDPLLDADRKFAPVNSRLERGLNEPQRKALDAALRARDYALVLGMPGTGKTTLIATLIRTLVGQGKTVLLASYTHSAVDNVLLKLKEEEFQVLRVGNVDKVHPGVRCMTLSAKKEAETLEQLEAQLMTPPVVATTCLSIDHPLFARRKFDCCIIDEASQITLPACVGPLRFASRFVLVGDHYQLPPLVKAHGARAGGLGTSLFRHLADAHPEAVYALDEQYRMCEDIMALANKVVYEGRLRCGNEETAKRMLVLPSPSAGLKCDSSSHGRGREGAKCWMKRVLDPSTTAIFISTSKLGSIAYDSRAGDLPQNMFEARLALRLTRALLQAGLPGKELALISPYRQQNKVLSAGLAAMQGDTEEKQKADVEILTADRAQGRDYDAVLVSLVRSNDEGQVGHLLTDRRRINVAFTRARSKLVLFGCARTLKASDVMKEMIELMESRGWVHELDEEELRLHASMDGETPKAALEEVKVGAKMEMKTEIKLDAKPETHVEVKVEEVDQVAIKQEVGMEVKLEPTDADVVMYTPNEANMERVKQEVVEDKVVKVLVKEEYDDDDDVVVVVKDEDDDDVELIEAQPPARSLGDAKPRYVKMEVDNDVIDLTDD